MSDVARSVELVERLERAYNERDYDAVRACVAADLVAHTPAQRRCPPGSRGRSPRTRAGSTPSPTKSLRKSG